MTEAEELLDDEVAILIALQDGKELEEMLGKGGVWITLLRLARKASIAATVRIAVADPNDTKLIMRLQNEMRRYSDLVAWIKQIIENVQEAEEQATEDDRILIEQLRGEQQETD